MKRAVRNSGGEILVISELIDTDTQVQGKKGISVMLKVKIKFQQLLNVLKPVAESIPVDIQGLCGLLDIKGVVEILLKCFEKIRIIAASYSIRGDMMSRLSFRKSLSSGIFKIW